jgi:hypothetical protein
MVFGIIMVVATVVLAIAAYRVMSKPVPPPTAVAPPPLDEREIEAIRMAAQRGRPTPRPRGPIRQSLPPVTLETLPPPGLVRPSEEALPAPASEPVTPGSIVPAIDQGVFAALAASSKSAPAESPIPQLARGSGPASFTSAPDDLDDSAETLRGTSSTSSESDDDVLTRTHTSSV